MTSSSRQHLWPTHRRRRKIRQSIRRANTRKARRLGRRDPKSITRPSETGETA